MAKMTDRAPSARDAKRNIGAELLASVRQMKARKVGRVHRVVSAECQDVENPQSHSTTLQAHHFPGAAMKVLVFVKATPNSEKGIMPNDEQLKKLFTDMGNFNEQLVKAGIMQEADGLKPSSAGKRITFSDQGHTSVVDGPFVETKELVAGYWVWNVKSLDEAVEWAKRCPNPMPGEEGVLELRPTNMLEDFGDLLTDEHLAQEKRLRKEVTRQQKAKVKGSAKRVARSKPAKRPAKRKPVRAKSKK